MKFFLLFSLLIAASFTNAQTGKVSSLPAGVYEVQKAGKLSHDIILIDDSHYRLRNEDTVSEYKFSATAQRVLFISGVLKGVFAKTVINGDAPAIVLPKKENEALGHRLADADVWAQFKRQL
jgi:hypothetical protein